MQGINKMLPPVPEQWGAPLTGAQMNLLRAAGLPDGTEFEVFVDRWGFCSAGETRVGDIHDGAPCRLPADHPAYTLLEAGWLDGRNVRLWFGGDKAPDDWDEGSWPLCRDGLEADCNWKWEHKYGFADIIAYTRKAECEYPPANEKLKEAVRLSREMTAQPETVTIAKMTEAEWELRVNSYGMLFEDVKDIISDLGLIKPEPTRLQRFWRSKCREGELWEDIIKEALEFER